MRGKYIYLACNRAGGILAGFTVKHEAHTWVERRRLDYKTLMLLRVPDGEPPTEIEWEPELFNLKTGNLNDHLVRAVSEVADWPGYAKRCL